MFCHNHEAVTTPSPVPGQAALRGKSGCSLRKALPGKRRIELFDVFLFIVELLVGDAACLSSQVRALVLWWCAAAACCGGVLEVRVGFTSSQDTRHKLVASHLFSVLLS